MPLDDKELLITMINKQNDKNRPSNSDEGLLKFGLKFLIFLDLFGILGVTLGPIFGTIVWIILLAIYAIISLSGSSSNSNNKKHFNSSTKDKKYRCAECGHSFTGLVDKCPNCGVTFNLNEPENEKEHICRNCGFRFKGRLEKCPKCGKKMLY